MMRGRPVIAIQFNLIYTILAFKVNEVYQDVMKEIKSRKKMKFVCERWLK